MRSFVPTWRQFLEWSLLSKWSFVASVVAVFTIPSLGLLYWQAISTLLVGPRPIEVRLLNEIDSDAIHTFEAVPSANVEDQSHPPGDEARSSRSTRVARGLPKDSIASGSDERVAQLRHATTAASGIRSHSDAKRVMLAYESLNQFDLARLDPGLIESVNRARALIADQTRRINRLAGALDEWKRTATATTLTGVLKRLSDLTPIDVDELEGDQREIVENANELQIKHARRKAWLSSPSSSPLRWFFDVDNVSSIASDAEAPMRRNLNENGYRVVSSLVDADVAVRVSGDVRTSETQFGTVSVHGSYVTLHIEANWTIDRETLAVVEATIRTTSTLSKDAAQNRAIRRAAEKIVTDLTRSILPRNP